MVALACMAYAIYKGRVGYGRWEGSANLRGHVAIRLDYGTRILHTAQNILRARDGPTTTKPKK